jgi:hypothetical protein
MAGKAFAPFATCRSTPDSIRQRPVAGSIIEVPQSARTCLFFDVALSRTDSSSRHLKGQMSRVALRD